MARDPLPTLLRLRRLAADEAKRALAEALGREAQAEAVAVGAEREIARETEIAMGLEADDAAVEAFGRWLTGSRRRVAGAREAAERAGAETARARAALNLTRAGLEAAEELAAGRARVQAEAKMRYEQHALDDLTRRGGHG